MDHGVGGKSTRSAPPRAPDDAGSVVPTYSEHDAAQADIDAAQVDRGNPAEEDNMRIRTSSFGSGVPRMLDDMPAPVPRSGPAKTLRTCSPPPAQPAAVVRGMDVPKPTDLCVGQALGLEERVARLEAEVLEILRSQSVWKERMEAATRDTDARLDALVAENELAKRSRRHQFGSIIVDTESAVYLSECAKAVASDCERSTEQVQSLQTPPSECAEAEDKEGRIWVVKSDKIQVTRDRLDNGDEYKVKESVWDAALFVCLPCVGRDVSIIMLVALLFNTAIQLLFCYIVYEYMLEDHLEPHKLTQLLHFRASVGHDVRYADKMMRKSMIAQLCEEESNLHMAGGQKELWKDLKEFREGGPFLATLALFCWIGTIMKELALCCQFARALLSAQRGPRTEFVICNSDPNRLVSMEEHDQDLSANLSKLTVVTKLTCIAPGRVSSCIFLLALPRFVIAVLLGIVGVLFLSVTTNMEDLLLNTIALEFVINLDELCYVLFMPRRLRVLVQNMEPFTLLPNIADRKLKCGSLTAMFKMVFIFTLVVVIYAGVLASSFGRLQQAMDILCSGEKNFVYATNAATGIVHVARTQYARDWTDSEMVVLQLAKPRIDEGYGWEPGQVLLDTTRSSSTAAVMESDPPANNLEQAGFSPVSFDLVSVMGASDMKGAAEKLGCADDAAAPSAAVLRSKLVQLTGNSSVRVCADLLSLPPETQAQLCPSLGGYEIRAHCPITCGCTRTKASVGFFGSPAFGCPEACLQLKTTRYEIDYYIHGGVHHCADQPPEMILETQPWFSHYVTGLFDAALSKSYYKASLRTLTMHGVMMGYIPGFCLPGTRTAAGCAPNMTSVQTFIQHVESKQLVRTILAGRWELLPGIPHTMPMTDGPPRHLKGCDYLASFAIKFLVGVDVCAVGVFTSLRVVCPAICGCNGVAMAECPLECKNGPTPPPLSYLKYHWRSSCQPRLDDGQSCEVCSDEQCSRYWRGTNATHYNDACGNCTSNSSSGSS